MKNIEGYVLPFDITKLKLRTNLIEFDGPLLSLYYSEGGDYYLFYWVDRDERFNRWIILRVGINSLIRYLRQETTLYQIITNSADNFVRVADIDGKGEINMIKCITSDMLPSDYLPEEDSYFTFDHKQKLLDEVSMETYGIDIPKSDRNTFAIIASKMGWRFSTATIKDLLNKSAVL